MDRALLPCPFCGSGNVDPEGWATVHASGRVSRGPECDDCGATATSVEAWNARPRLTVALAQPGTDAGVKEAIAAAIDPLAFDPAVAAECDYPAGKRQLAKAQERALGAARRVIAALRSRSTGASEPAPSIATVVDAAWPWDAVHDVRPKPHGLEGRWCARCGISETTASLEGLKCQPIYAGQKPYGSRSTRATVELLEENFRQAAEVLIRQRDEARPAGASFQERVQEWLLACFGAEIAADKIERNHRFLEEAIELVQACGCTASEAHQLVDYVYGRPVGDQRQEVGDVMNTLAALCLAHGLDMNECAEAEMARVWTLVEKIRAKRAAKPKHSPLPEHVRSAGATVGVPEGPVWGIIDPDYARVFTTARCIAWSEGYALVMHGSFTRDLDLLAVPWTERATDAEHLVRRIALALDDLSLLVKDPKAASQASEKPHGRKAWTLTFKTFGDPRFVDLSVMPRLADREREQP